jgi:phage gp29-like protein
MSKRVGKKQFENWGPDKKIEGGAEHIEKSDTDGGHFATRQRANDFVRLMRSLPDPDPVLRKMGRGITALQELLTDSHLESVWSIRCSAASGAEWFCAAGGEGRREKEAAEVFAEQLGNLDTPRIIEEMMDAVAYGYSPLEVIWVPDGGRWGIGDIVGKPPQWFEFDQENRLVFRTGVVGTEELPANRFLVARHRPSYANPYGVKVFSKCYWPVTFKKNGFRWWTVFVEKYGGAFLYGKYPGNAGEQYKKELLTALEKMVSDAVAIIPEGAEITIESLANKGGVSSVHSGYIEAANKEISKAVLGQTLTTEVGSTGSYAAAKAHDLVRKDLAASDRVRISECFNRLAAVWSFYNYGAEVAPPKFEFVKDEDLYTERVERDVKLYTIGVRPKKSYITREYEIPEEDFDIVDNTGGAGGQDFRHAAPGHFTAGGCGCGAAHGARGKRTLLQKFAALFASKASKNAGKDRKLRKEFSDLLIEEGQDEIDKTIEGLVDALGLVDSYEDAYAVLMSAYDKHTVKDFANLVYETRFAAIGIGDRDA